MQANQSPTQTIYASKTPRDLNHDPEPWADERGMRWDSPGDGAWHMPRPEFDHVQHNEPNPILMAFRRDAAEMKHQRGWTVAMTALSWDRDAFDPFVDMYDLAVLDHARKVLTRLENLPSAPQSTTQSYTTHHAQR